MGYRSEVKLVVYDPNDETREASYKKLQMHIDDLELKAPCNGNEVCLEVPDKAFWSMMMDMWEIAHDDDESNKFVQFYSEWMKCYDVWDKGVREITEWAESNKCLWAYGRIGEDFDDVEVRNGGDDVEGNIYVCINRSIGSICID